MQNKNVKLKFDYDSKYDDFFAHVKTTKSKGSAIFGDLVLDYDKNNELVGVQFTDATKFLSKITEMNDEKRMQELLENLTDCVLEILNDDAIVTVRVRLTGRKGSIAPIFSVPKEQLGPEVAYA